MLRIGALACVFSHLMKMNLDYDYCFADQKL